MRPAPQPAVNGPRPLPPRAVALCLGAALVLGAILDRATGWVTRLDHVLLDSTFVLSRTLSPPRDEHGLARVAIVGIDDESLRRAREPLALLHRQLGAALEEIAAQGPRIVVLDIALPERGADSHAPGADAALLRGLVLARESAPLVLAVDADADGRLIVPHAPLLAAAGGEGALALALLPRDCDGSVRRFSPDPSHQAAGTLPEGGLRSCTEAWDAPPGPVVLPVLETLAARRLGEGRRLARPGWIDYSKGPPFSYIPLHELAQGSPSEAARARLRGSIVLVGSVLPFQDEVAQPVNLAAWMPRGAGPAPGIVAHAQALRTGLGPGLLAGASAPWRATLAVLLLVAAMPARVRLRAALLVAAIPAALAAALLALQAGAVLPLGLPILLGAIAFLLRTLADLAWSRREHARLAGSFAGYVSPGVLDALLEGRIGAAGERRTVAILFADLQGFTTWSEHAPAELVLASLNRWYSAAAPLLHRHGGTIDNFRGDGILVVFGAPDGLAQPCDAAFAAARELLALAAGMSFGAPAPGLPALSPLRLRIGLSYGEAVTGELGSAERRDFTALGDCVNVAARLHELARDRACDLAMTATFAGALSAAPPGLLALGPVPLRGHSPVEAALWSAPEKSTGPGAD